MKLHYLLANKWLAWPYGVSHVILIAPSVVQMVYKTDKKRDINLRIDATEPVGTVCDKDKFDLAREAIVADPFTRDQYTEGEITDDPNGIYDYVRQGATMEEIVRGAVYTINVLQSKLAIERTFRLQANTNRFKSRLLKRAAEGEAQEVTKRVSNNQRLAPMVWEELKHRSRPFAWPTDNQNLAITLKQDDKGFLVDPNDPELRRAVGKRFKLAHPAHNTVTVFQVVAVALSEFFGRHVFKFEDLINSRMGHMLDHVNRELAYMEVNLAEQYRGQIDYPYWKGFSLLAKCRAIEEGLQGVAANTRAQQILDEMCVWMMGLSKARNAAKPIDELAIVNPQKAAPVMQDAEDYENFDAEAMLAQFEQEQQQTAPAPSTATQQIGEHGNESVGFNFFDNPPQ